MGSNELIEKVHGIDLPYTRIERFIKSFEKDYDAEIVALISSWLSNGYRNEEFVVEYIVSEIMGGHPCQYVLTKKDYDTDNPISMCGMMTFGNFDMLMLKLKQTNLLMDGLQCSISKYMNNGRHKCRYVHNALSLMLGGGTGFPTIQSNGTFFRFNHLAYTLSHRLHLWNDLDNERMLLPCNDHIFQKAYECGIIRRPMKSTLRNTIELTKIARGMLGNDFFLLYDYLNYV